MRPLNRKGTIMQAISEIGMAVIALIVCFLLAIYFINSKKDSNREASAAEMQKARFASEIALYLKQPVSVGGRQMTMSELAILANYNLDDTPERYLSEWKKETSAFFTGSWMKDEASTVQFSMGDISHVAELSGSGSFWSKPKGAKLRHEQEVWLPSPAEDLQPVRLLIRVSAPDPESYDVK